MSENRDFWADLNAVFEQLKADGAREDIAPESFSGSLEFQDPRGPVESVIISEAQGSKVAPLVVPRLVAALKKVDSSIPLHVLKMKSDEATAEKISEAFDEYEVSYVAIDMLRDSNWFIDTYLNGKLKRTQGPFFQKMSHAGLWTRDAFHFLKKRDLMGSLSGYHLVQMPTDEFAFRVPVEMFRGILGTQTSLHFFSNLRSKTDIPELFQGLQKQKDITLIPSQNTGDHIKGGNLVPLSSKVAFVGSQMPENLKASYATHGLSLIPVEWKSQTNHVDEIFMVIPDPSNKECGIALLFADPSKTARMNDIHYQPMAKVIREAIQKARQVLNCPGLQAFGLPHYGSSAMINELSGIVFDGETVDAARTQSKKMNLENIPNLINGLVFPRKNGGVDLLLPKPIDIRDEETAERTFEEVSHLTAQPVRVFFIQLDEVFDKGGGLHCLTQDPRCNLTP